MKNNRPQLAVVFSSVGWKVNCEPHDALSLLTSPNLKDKIENIGSHTYFVCNVQSNMESFVTR